MPTQRLSQWIALRCKEPLFWRFLKVQDEPSAVQKVRTLCGVKSRSEFDRDADAEARLHQIIRYPFIDFTHDQEKACSN